MELLRTLMHLQESNGYLSDDVLREVSKERAVPLYHLEGLVSFYPAFRRTPPPLQCVQVCRDICCTMANAEQITRQLREGTTEDDNIEVQPVSCLGRCDQAPAVAVNELPRSLASVEVTDFLGQLQGEDSSVLAPLSESERTWKCDPYGSPSDHFGTVCALLQSEMELQTHCVEVLTQSGLRGMGGAGFPTGKKWELVAGEAENPKSVICNADESEPGTFKDRMILAELPHLVIEGLLLAGLSIGAEQGIIYLRHEYEPERQRLQAALDVAAESGILGENAAGSGQRFEIEIFVSPGGYILGEETALLEALEDRRGEPRLKPPYPGTVGLWGKPTLINNVETFALATSIVHHGVDWWRDQGRNDSQGLKFVSISGDVEQPGVYEIPLGMPVAELIELAGGMKDGQTLQAFLPGGASSNFLPASAAATPLDFDAMKQAGSMLGTGAVIVIAEGRDLFALATNLVTFFRNESCGKCVPCRVGSEKAVGLLEGVQNGTEAATSLETLPELGTTLELTSICGLGQVALNPILSMLKHFPDAVPGG